MAFINHQSASDKIPKRLVKAIALGGHEDDAESVSRMKTDVLLTKQKTKEIG